MICYINYRRDHNTHTVVAGENPYRSVPTLDAAGVARVFGPVPGDVINVVDAVTYDVAGKPSLCDYQYDSAETAIIAHSMIIGDTRLITG